MRKSPCCRLKARRFGPRRWQCTACNRTWRIRLKRRGRPARRHDHRLISRVFRGRRTLTEIALERGLSRQALSHRFRKALKQLAIIPCVSNGESILLMDGLWFRFKRRPWVLYLMALRPVASDTATFMTPLMLEGPESKQAWLKALATIPEDSRARIRALVCDNFVGSRSIAQSNQWVLQLCHFHLIAQLRRRLGYKNHRTAGRQTRQIAYRMIRKLLDTPSEQEANSLTGSLRMLAREGIGGRRYTNLVREFLRRLSYYRSYQAHPALMLPKTTGSAESMGRRVRDLERRTRGFSSANAAFLWMIHYINSKPKIICRPGKLSTN